MVYKRKEAFYPVFILIYSFQGKDILGAQNPPPAAVIVSVVRLVLETDSRAKCLTNFHPSSNKALAYFPIKLMKPDKKTLEESKGPQAKWNHISWNSTFSIIYIGNIKKFIYSEMIDTYVTILKSYADRAVPGSSLNAPSWIYEDGVIDLQTSLRRRCSEWWWICREHLHPLI